MHSGCVTNNAKCYMWGDNSYRQLGCMTKFSQQAILEPVLLQLDDENEEDGVESIKDIKIFTNWWCINSLCFKEIL